MTEPPIHQHHDQTFERLEKAEGWMSKVAIVIALIVGAAMAVGLLTATGHVTW